jgi:peptidoglycan/xylan/chitin deacetylase (PgdA/CDA1 family)
MGGILDKAKSKGRKTLEAAIHWGGVGLAYEMIVRPVGAVILMYHSIPCDDLRRFVAPANRLDRKVFDRQMAFLRKNRTVLPLAHLVEYIDAGRPPPPKTVCITFDDGYLDTFTVAAPILAKYELSATVFLATGYIARAEPQWADLLHWMLTWRSCHRFSLPNAFAGHLDLSVPKHLVAAVGFLHRRLLEANYPNRMELLRIVEHQLCPVGTLPRLTMTWADVREMCRKYPNIAIGGHTRNHVDLSVHYQEDVASLEIEGCAVDIRSELSMDVEHFSFPYGRSCEETRRFVRESGWKSAVAAGSGVRITSKSDRFAMPRISAPNHVRELAFKTHPAYPGILPFFGLNG